MFVCLDFRIRPLSPHFRVIRWCFPSSCFENLAHEILDRILSYIFTCSYYPHLKCFATLALASLEVSRELRTVVHKRNFWLDADFFFEDLIFCEHHFANVDQEYSTVASIVLHRFIISRSAIQI